jgi:HD-GYP domain-containing protein (c-di-GMP phosphodiesterase class II)
MNQLEKMEQLNQQQRELFQITVTTLTSSITIRDAYTGEHSVRVAQFALLIGKQMRLSDEELEVIAYAAPMHDIGKIGIPDEILRKPGPLTPDEFTVMKTHTTQGAKIVGMVPALSQAVPIVRSHHEHWDGKGYPDSLAGEEIPLLARVVALADCFEAMVFGTPCHKALPVKQAFAEIEKQQGRQFDPKIVKALLQCRDKVVDLIISLNARREIRGNSQS